MAIRYTPQVPLMSQLGGPRHNSTSFCALKSDSPSSAAPSLDVFSSFSSLLGNELGVNGLKHIPLLLLRLNACCPQGPGYAGTLLDMRSRPPAPATSRVQRPYVSCGVDPNQTGHVERWRASVCTLTLTRSSLGSSSAGLQKRQSDQSNRYSLFSQQGAWVSDSAAENVYSYLLSCGSNPRPLPPALTSPLTRLWGEPRPGITGNGPQDTIVRENSPVEPPTPRLRGWIRDEHPRRRRENGRFPSLGVYASCSE